MTDHSEAPLLPCRNRRRTDLERFEEKFIPEPMSGCWLWTGALYPRGYGKFWFDGELGLAHRASLSLYCDRPAADKLVCHRCNNPQCVNPDHLYIGTQSDNMKQARRDGRVIMPHEMKL